MSSINQKLCLKRQVDFCVHLNRGNPVHRDFRTWWLECRMHGEKVRFCRTFPKASKDSLKPTKTALKPQLQQKRKSPQQNSEHIKPCKIGLFLWWGYVYKYIHTCT